jgi:septal ring factor EnvC (AmiA/AmiB activator)
MNAELLDFIKSIITPTAIGAGSTGVFWFFSRRKKEAETKASELDNVEDAIKIWRDMAQSLESIRKTQEDKLEILTAEVHELRAQVDELEVQNGKLKRELARLKRTASEKKTPPKKDSSL